MDKNQTQTTGSDFANKFFTPEEGRHWNNLLFRLRSFEEAVCKNFRKIESKITEGQNLPSNSSSSEIDKINALIDGKFEKLENQFKNLKQIVKEEISNLGVDNDLNKTKMKEIENKMDDRELKDELVFLRSKNMEIEKEQILQIQRLNILEEGMENVENNLTKNEQKIAEIIAKNARKLIDKIESLEAKVEVLENGSRGSGFSWNGHGSEESVDLNLKTKPPEKASEAAEKPITGENVEIMIGDPFLNGLMTPVGVYDGNPTSSFSKFFQRFMDALNLIITPLNEAQKLSRLKVCLGGRARAELDAKFPQPATLQEAIDFLQEKFVNGHSRTVARQALSIIKQAPGERVFEFAQRLNDAVRAVMIGYEENTIQQRLLDEFLDRLMPDLQFEVKAARPDDYSKAFEVAEHFELLLNEKRQKHQYVDLAEKVEALAINRSREIRRLCYYCHKPGHVIADCRNRSRKNYKSRQYNNYERRNYQNNYWENRQNYRNEYNRDNSRYNDRNRENSRESSPNNYSRSPTRRVRFSESRVASPLRISSPYLLTIFALIAIISPTLASYGAQIEMNCPAYSPFTFKEKTINNNWEITELPKESILSTNYMRLLTLNQILIFLALLGVSTVLFLLMFFIKPILFKIIKNLRKNKKSEPEKEINVAEIAPGYDNTCDEWFRIKTKINGKEIICLLDSGAHVSLTGRETAEKLKIKEIFPADLSAIVGIGNKIVPTLGQGEIIFQIAGCEILTQIVILENEISKTGKYDVIIGRETLKSLPLFLDLQTGKLIAKSLIKNCQIKEMEKIQLKLIENNKLKIFAILKIFPK
uniref:CCHC-type domain-containing protein n=2 Tax=Meloidogyne enterolobii TaxID=390850 RepID=A0A6V7XJR4_MELEN|nr:unnamed protein product [Meloidogyne enterolobii]